MRALIRVAIAMLVLAAVLVGLGYSMLRASGTSIVQEGRELATEQREVGAATRSVVLEGPIDLTVRQGTTASLSVSGERRLLGNVEVRQDGEQINIGIRGMVLRHRQPLQVSLVLPQLDSLSTAGSGDATVNGFSGQFMSIAMNGSGDVRFNGRFKQLDLEVNGSGDLDLNGGAAIDRVQARLIGSGHLTVVGNTRELDAHNKGSGELSAEHLRAETVALAQTGSGNSTVQAYRQVRINNTGSGRIAVHGNPRERSSSRTGSGEVSFVD